jgi:nucleoside-diphosphate-sugar epimerase
VADPRVAFTVIHINDLARGVLLAASDDRACGETIFFGHPRPQTTDAIMRGLAEAVGRPYRPKRVPRLLMRTIAYAGELSWLFGRSPIVDAARLRELDAGGFVCSVERAQAVLGFTAALDWTEGVETTARWYRQHGWL